MRNVLIFGISALLLGCPESPVDRPEISDDCALEYAVAVIDVAGSEDAACDAAFDAAHLADEGADEQWYEYHTQAWNNITDGMKEHCGEGLDVRAEFLYNEQIIRFRCIVGKSSPDPDVCSGYDPDACSD